jgi:hypothetical protein
MLGMASRLVDSQNHKGHEGSLRRSFVSFVVYEFATLSTIAPVSILVEWVALLYLFP